MHRSQRAPPLLDRIVDAGHSCDCPGSEGLIGDQFEQSGSVVSSPTVAPTATVLGCGEEKGSAQGTRRSAASCGGRRGALPQVREAVPTGTIRATVYGWGRNSDENNGDPEPASSVFQDQTTAAVPARGGGAARNEDGMKRAPRGKVRFL